MHNALLQLRRSDRWIHLVLVSCGAIGLVLFVTVTFPEYRVALRHGCLAPDTINIAAIPDEGLSSHSKLEAHHLGEDVEAERLKDEVRVLCLVLTHPGNHLKKAKHVQLTWGKRCNKLIFMSTLDDPELGAVDLKVEEHYGNLYSKSRAGFKYVYDRYLNEYDWFFKADDDTYTIMENMRYMLSSYDPSFPIYFGSRFKPFTKQGYMSGGGGYVLSREALRLFVEVGISTDTCKDKRSFAEDAEMGICLDKVGVLAGDSRDSFGRGRFFPFDPPTHLHGGVPDWYLKYVYYKPDMGLNCCSDTPVTFHYVGPNHMYVLEYLLYHARPYGIVHNDPFPAQLPQDKKSIPKAVLEKYGKLESPDASTNQPSKTPKEATTKPSVNPSTEKKASGPNSTPQNATKKPT